MWEKPFAHATSQRMVSFSSVCLSILSHFWSILPVERALPGTRFLFHQQLQLFRDLREHANRQVAV